MKERVIVRNKGKEIKRLRKRKEREGGDRKKIEKEVDERRYKSKQKEIKEKEGRERKKEKKIECMEEMDVYYRENQQIKE